MLAIGMYAGLYTKGQKSKNGIYASGEEYSMANSNREFRKIPSLNFLYEVSEDGRSFRNVKSKKESKIIVDHHHSEKGYHHTFVNIKGHVQRVPIARVVAETFIGPKPEGMEIDHIDRNSLNDDYHNLRYVTKSEQMKNRDHTNIVAQGTKNILAHVNEVKQYVYLVDEEGEEIYFDSKAAAARALAEEYGTSVEHMRAKLKKKRSHIYGYDVGYK